MDDFFKQNMTFLLYSVARTACNPVAPPFIHESWNYVYVNVADSMVISILSRPVVISPAFADVLLF
jgi:hypothetical protein